MTAPIAAASAQIFDDLRRTGRPAFERDPHILWGGAYGSFARHRQQEDSDVDILLIYDDTYRRHDESPWIQDDLKEIWGREIGLVGIWYLDFNYYVQLEGVLAARTLYGDPNILEEMRAKSEGHLRQAETRMTEATRAIERLHRSLESAGSFEALVGAQSTNLRRQIRVQLDKLLDLVSWRGGGIENIFRYLWKINCIEDAEHVSSLISGADDDFSSPKTQDAWRELWRYAVEEYWFYRNSMWQISVDGDLAQTFALKKIREDLEAGRDPDPALYKRIIRGRYG